MFSVLLYHTAHLIIFLFFPHLHERDKTTRLTAYTSKVFVLHFSFLGKAVFARVWEKPALL